MDAKRTAKPVSKRKNSCPLFPAGFRNGLLSDFAPGRRTAYIHWHIWAFDGRRHLCFPLLGFDFEYTKMVRFSGLIAGDNIPSFVLIAVLQ